MITIFFPVAYRLRIFTTENMPRKRNSNSIELLSAEEDLNDDDELNAPLIESTDNFVAVRGENPGVFNSESA